MKWIDKLREKEKKRNREAWNEWLNDSIEEASHKSGTNELLADGTPVTNGAMLYHIAALERRVERLEQEKKDASEEDR